MMEDVQIRALRSGPEAVWRVAWRPVGNRAWAAHVGLVGVGAAWLLYTKLYFFLHPKGLTAAPSLFMHLTGRPDPFCGLTRTFAWMWQGDLREAILAYPLGPVVFIATWVVMAVLAYSVVARRTPHVRIRRDVGVALIAVVLLALAANWTAKLLWLGV
jgi:hypothetical protein